MRLQIIAIAGLLLALGCGDDDAPTTDAGTATDAGGAADAAAVTGCAAPGAAPCPGSQMCCSGVPYPTEGICMDQCLAVSDRHLKENFAAVDGDVLLDKLSALRVQRWSYRSEPGVEHVGPMAQDFHAAFGVGPDDRHIHPVDAQGITMAAIQALHRRLEALEAENHQLSQRSCR